MAKYVVTDATLSINGEDVSSAVARAELSQTAAEVDVTDFGSGGNTELIGGLKSGSLSFDIHQDYGTGAVSTVLQDLVGTIGTFVVTPNGATPSSENPQFTATALITTVTFVSGSVGDLATASYTFPTTGGITIATA